MMIFYVHHALRESNSTPSQNDNIKNVGKEDAEIVAQLFLDAKLRGINISAIYTSPYYRCKETANIINKHINVPMFEDERLNEFVGERGVKKYGLPQKAAETWTACQMRVIACLKDIVNTYNDDEIVVCVTSGVNLTAFISLAYQVQPSENLPFPSVPSCSPIGFNINKDSFTFLNNNR